MARLRLIFCLYTQICAHSAVSIPNPTFPSSQSGAISFHTTSLCLAGLILGAWKRSECSSEGGVIVIREWKIALRVYKNSSMVFAVGRGELPEKDVFSTEGQRSFGDWSCWLLITETSLWQPPFGSAPLGKQHEGKGTLGHGIYCTAPWKHDPLQHFL